jgi:Tfp pilus assembly protein PilX
MRRKLLTHRPAAGHTQRGATLVIGLIMLVLITLVAVAAIRMSTTHVQVVGNERFRTEATTAANYALDLVINNKDFVDAKLSANPVAVNVVETNMANGALTAKYTDPSCSRYRYIKNAELIKTVTDADGNSVAVPKSKTDRACFNNPKVDITIVNETVTGDPNANSLCVTTMWDVAASVEDPDTGAAVTVNQGIEMRMEITDAENKCKP